MTLDEITQQQLTEPEKESILAHAVDLHLRGSEEADHEGFNVVEKSGLKVKHLFRITVEGKPAGVIYLLPFADLPGHFEMTILIHETFRGRHLTGEAVSLLESFMRSRMGDARAVCAKVHEHSPLRRELTEFLLRHGYSYEPAHLAFIKSL